VCVAECLVGVGVRWFIAFCVLGRFVPAGSLLFVIAFILWCLLVDCVRDGLLF